VILVDTALKTGHGWIAAAILVTGFLTTLAVGRVWIFAFWRGGAEGVVDGSLTSFKVPAAGAGGLSIWLPLLALLAIVVALGVQPEPMMQLAQKGAITLSEPAGYLRSVFGEAAQ
jgi:multicomponent Na+:H+ antiporter subunit D